MTPRRLKQIPYLNTGLPKDSAELKCLMSYIAGIDDALTRQIFVYRYVDQCRWDQVARKIGGWNTAEGVRQRHNRYLRKH